MDEHSEAIRAILGAASAPRPSATSKKKRSRFDAPPPSNGPRPAAPTAHAVAAAPVTVAVQSKRAKIAVTLGLASLAAATAAAPASSSGAASAAPALRAPRHTVSAGTFDVDSMDVVQLVLQFLRESGFHAAMTSLQHEADVGLRAVESSAALAADIKAGRWDAVLPAVSALQLSREKQLFLYEQATLEMVESGEHELARMLLRQSAPFAWLKADNPERYLAFEQLVTRAASRGSHFDAAEIWQFAGDAKAIRRAELAAAVTDGLADAPPSRLLSLVGQALKWQQHLGALPLAGGASASAAGAGGGGGGYDLFRAAVKRRQRDADERPVRRLQCAVKLGAKTHAHCALFAPNGTFLATGSSDGFIEIWDVDSGKLRRDLPYQAGDEPMMHDDAVLCLASSRDSQHLAAGDAAGRLQVWKVETGQVLRTFDRAHSSGVSCLAFFKDGGQVLSGSLDGGVRVHGLKSGRMLKDFRGHTSYVTAVGHRADGSAVVSASADGTVRVWDAKSTEPLLTFRPAGEGAGGGEIAVVCCEQLPGAARLAAEHLLVADRSSTLRVMNVRGQLIKSFAADDEAAAAEAAAAPSDVVAAASSAQGKFAYAVGSDGRLRCFSTRSGEAEASPLRVSDKEMLGVVHHPFRNIVATFGKEGEVRLWAP